MNIHLADPATLENNCQMNKKEYRQVLGITMKERTIQTIVLVYKDDSKAPDIFTWYGESRTVKRQSKTDFENKEYEDTTLTLKQIMEAAVQLTDRDQVTINDKTVFVLERDIGFEGPAIRKHSQLMDDGSTVK